MTNLPEAPKSATVKVISPAGFHWLCTVRGDDKASLMQDMLSFEKSVTDASWFPEPSFQRVPPETPPANAPRVHYKGATPPAECPHEHIAQKQSTGKSKPENAGRWYEACADCGKFIRWV